MAHAWKACWVQALGGSNPPFSAKVTSVLGASTAPSAGVRIPDSLPVFRSIRRDAEHRLERRARRQLHEAEAVVEGAGRPVCRIHGEVHPTDALLAQRGQQGVHQLASETLALEFGKEI